MDHIKALYEEEIEVYKQQIQELRLRNKTCDEQNTALINKIRNMEELIEKASQANKDLNVAFDHVRDENLRLQLNRRDREQPPAITHREPEPRVIEAAESLSWISERDRMNQRIKFLERECGRYHRDTTTLGKQVRHLLRSLEEERGMIIRHQSEVSADERLVSAADVIDKHLVTFESIEQLQQQNQKLLTLVKNLSAEQEERDITVESEEVQKLNAQIQELSEQLNTIKGDRERVLSALNTIHKERDLFKILLCKTREVEHMTPEIFQRMVSVACSSGPAIEDKVGITAEKEAHIGDLKGMIAKLEEYVENLRKELEVVRKESREEIQLKDGLLQKAHSKILDETKRADVLHERNEILESNIQAITTEFDETRVKCYKLTYDVEEVKKEFEAKILEETKRADGLKEQVETLQSNIDSLTNELTETKDTASDLEVNVAEKEAIIEELEGKVIELEECVENLRKEFTEAQTEKDSHIEELEIKISELEEYIGNLRKEFEEMRKESQEKIQLKDAMLQEANSKISDETKRADELCERNRILEGNIQAITTQFDETRVKCSKSTHDVEGIKKVYEAKVSEETKRADALKEQVVMLQSEIASLTNELTEAKNSALVPSTNDITEANDSVPVPSTNEPREAENTAPVPSATDITEVYDTDPVPSTNELTEAENITLVPSTNDITEVYDTDPVPSTNELTEADNIALVPSTNDITEVYDTDPVPSTNEFTEAENIALVPSTNDITEAENIALVPSTNELTEVMDSVPVPSTNEITEAMDSAPVPPTNDIREAMNSAPVPEANVDPPEKQHVISLKRRRLDDNTFS